MTITLKLWAYFRDYLPAQDRKNLETRIDVAQGASVLDIIRQAGLPLAECRLVTVNGTVHVDRGRWADVVLSDGDALGVLPNVH